MSVAHWEFSKTGTNWRAAYIDETGKWIGGVDKVTRSSRYVYPWIRVDIGEWNGRLDRNDEWEVRYTEVADAMRIVEQFWRAHGIESAEEAVS